MEGLCTLLWHSVKKIVRGYCEITTHNTSCSIMVLISFPLDPVHLITLLFPSLTQILPHRLIHLSQSYVNSLVGTLV